MGKSGFPGASWAPGCLHGANDQNLHGEPDWARSWALGHSWPTEGLEQGLSWAPEETVRGGLSLAAESYLGLGQGYAKFQQFSNCLGLRLSLHASCSEPGQTNPGPARSLGL